MKILLVIFYFSIPSEGSYSVIAGTIQTFSTMEACLVEAAKLAKGLSATPLPYDYYQSYYLTNCLPLEVK